MFIIDFILNLLPAKKKLKVGNKEYSYEVEKVLAVNTPICDQIFEDDEKFKDLDMSKPHAMAKVMDIGKGLQSYIIMNYAAIKADADEEVLAPQQNLWVVFGSGKSPIV